ncbi:hypothetical protein [Bacillus infantis]|uniref:hypothetical protein n=1 Tax=Bacillus infantis TaxID=324767 RepID=UPI003CF3A286
MGKNTAAASIRQRKTIISRLKLSWLNMRPMAKRILPRDEKNKKQKQQGTFFLLLFLLSI